MLSTITPDTPQGFVFPALMRVLEAFGLGKTSHDTACRMRDAFIANGGQWLDEAGAAKLDSELYTRYGSDKFRYVEMVDERGRAIGVDWSLFCNTMLASGPDVAADVFSTLIDLTVPRN